MMHSALQDIYSAEAEVDLIEISRKLALTEIKETVEFLRAEDHYEPTQFCLERHRERVEKIRRFFSQKRSGQ